MLYSYTLSIAFNIYSLSTISNIKQHQVLLFRDNKGLFSFIIKVLTFTTTDKSTALITIYRLLFTIIKNNYH